MDLPPSLVRAASNRAMKRGPQNTRVLDGPSPVLAPLGSDERRGHHAAHHSGDRRSSSGMLTSARLTPTGSLRSERPFGPYRPGTHRTHQAGSAEQERVPEHVVGSEAQELDLNRDEESGAEHGSGSPPPDFPATLALIKHRRLPGARGPSATPSSPHHRPRPKGSPAVPDPSGQLRPHRPARCCKS